MKMIARTLCGALLAGAAVQPSFAETMDCAAVTPQQIAALFDRWNDTLDTLDPKKVTANYAEDAVLLPTKSNTPRTTPAAIEEYFVHFLHDHPHGAINTRTITIGCNAASDVGTYTFTLDGKVPGEKTTLPARYSYNYVYRGGQWLILHHHSSAMPEPVTPVSASATAK